MKKILFLAAAFLALVACEEKVTIEGVDSIELSTENKTIANNGGSFSVMVTSSTDWTLAPKEENKWVHTNMTSGVDGDIVKFTIDPNTGKEDLNAVYVFEAGKATKELTITSLAKELVVIEVDKTEAILDYNKGEFRLNVKANVDNRRDVKASIDYKGAEQNWITTPVNLSGEEGYTATFAVQYAALEGLDDREASITISAPGAENVVVNVLQEAKHVLYTTGTNFTAEMKGETVAVPVFANVEYAINIESEEQGWISHDKREGENEYFKVNALESGKRSAVITFTQTDAEEGVEPLSATINITQVNILINWAVDMTGARLFPKWEVGGPGYQTYFTLETMVYFDELSKPAGGIYTIMGIEGKFLLRMGDVGNKINHLQVATSDGNYNCPFDFEPNRWYHIAVTSDYGQVTIYVDGVEQGYNSFGYLSSVNLSPGWSYETSSWNVTRAFWMGYSYNSERDLAGKMTEIRIWNKVLTAEEINAPDHFYTVDPNSDGLYSYWKFVEGEGSTIADATGKGNPLHGEIDVHSVNNVNKGDEGIKWVSVALPDR